MWFGCTGYACIRVAWFVPPTFAVVAQSVCPYHWPLRTTTRPFGHLCWRHVAGLPRRAAGWTFGPPCPGYFASVHRAQRLQCAHRLERGLDDFVGITSSPRTDSTPVFRSVGVGTPTEVWPKRRVRNIIEVAQVSCINTRFSDSFVAPLRLLYRSFVPRRDVGA